MFRTMFRRDYPGTELALREERRENRLFAFLIGIPSLLILTFFVYYFAPWEITYRDRGATVFRAQVKALPPYNTDRLEQVDSVSQHGVTVTAYYSRNEFCAPIFDYYRQIAPTHGWTYTFTDQRYGYPVDYYSGTFSGYAAYLEVSCDLSRLGYEIQISARSDLCFLNCWDQGYRPSSTSVSSAPLFG